MKKQRTVKGFKLLKGLNIPPTTAKKRKAGVEYRGTNPDGTWEIQKGIPLPIKKKRRHDGVYGEYLSLLPFNLMEVGDCVDFCEYFPHSMVYALNAANKCKSSYETGALFSARKLNNRVWLWRIK